ncbi:hypothetical protein HanRHA438_Chr15g0725941 [Helianthus annuus]|uniref:Uncharacterized protein n=1 Tax=Helianthus annuus TaxID=4232 RepID=A0A9K3E398_HELAN|nr:hypothetical protein HanXRQr2_Chr15g0713651 [Helianthus annuus]KAJ0452706.1 hypothetical protein HanHA300_Chr15g0582011 [Helianthus annuus]KAJ0457681.1 hypothetical protein HanIR_Chr15g0776501 [Helianthus annuus]KAJ0474616.1 hypothetical protein HanHA89_Chr15g0631761 [Helianthus annuus]KAJ0650173.1 hypothetical protein HanLR1_Chr15g0592681 [Helianthus annuus]
MPEIVPGNRRTWPLGEVSLDDVGAENYSLSSSQFSSFKSMVQRRKNMVEAEDHYQHHNNSCQISCRRLHRRKMVFLVPPVRSSRTIPPLDIPVPESPQQVLFIIDGVLVATMGETMSRAPGPPESIFISSKMSRWRVANGVGGAAVTVSAVGMDVEGQMCEGEKEIGNLRE